MAEIYFNETIITTTSVPIHVSITFTDVFNVSFSISTLYKGQITVT